MACQCSTVLKNAVQLLPGIAEKAEVDWGQTKGLKLGQQFQVGVNDDSHD